MTNEEQIESYETTDSRIENDVHRFLERHRGKPYYSKLVQPVDGIELRGFNALYGLSEIGLQLYNMELQIMTLETEIKTTKLRLAYAKSFAGSEKWSRSLTTKKKKMEELQKKMDSFIDRIPNMGVMKAQTRSL